MAKNGSNRQQNKVVSYQKGVTPRINIGLIIIGFIFVQMLIYVISFFNTSHIERHEVREGSLTVNTTYEGIALREEYLVTNPSAGYVNFYIYDGERTAVGDLVYTVDETGRLEKAGTGMFEESKLSDQELREFRTEIINYVHGFDEEDFDSVYDFKRSLKNTVAKISNVNFLKNLEELSGNDVINYCYAPMTGVVSYWTDGYEGKTAEQLTEKDFKKENYERKQVIGDEVVEKEAPIYKVCTSELWDVIIPMDAERGKAIEEQGYVKVRFQKNQYESWASTKLIYGEDGNSYLKLSFNNSMVTFISDRFLDVQLILEEETGLKIPLSAIVEKEFFLLEEPYLIDEGQKGKRTIIRQCYLEDGTISTERLTVGIYSYDEETGKYYVDATMLNTGDILHQLDNQTTDVVRERATLIGVYNINKGYADFREISILYQNEEYAIVKSDTEYGLKVYDYIVLNADSVKDQQFINK
ncbi:MAG: hypothetical protein IKO03_12350 [Lachnospiraceae bacterium]|nr:hypothetical protein [Lachnospiraceae bacterium]MBR3509543.1 hypothetical protein [Lachnospiraceae bacterium]MBR4608256.1 hypothetical protein [Lachnospiraceae bacterium]MBR6150777.1 hypothetical protein [Lachnospiraceae bacterium]